MSESEPPASRGPRDAFSEHAFQAGTNGWAPPPLVRTVVWLVKDVGVPVVLSGVLVAVVMGWVESPLTRIAHIERTVIEHAVTNAKFQTDLIEGLRNQRCLTAVSALAPRAELIAAAAVSDKPCVYLENMTRVGERR